MSDQTNNTIGKHQIDLRGRIRTARRTDTLGSSLRQRRTWYNDPPEGDLAPEKPSTEKKPAAAVTFTQADMDARMSNVRKEAEDRTRKSLLKELGIDPDDPKATELLKNKLTVAEQAEKDKAAAEEATKTELQKVQERVAAAEKERDEAKKLAAEVEAKRRTDLINGKLEALATKASALLPEDVVEWLNSKQKDDVLKLLSNDGKFDEKKAQEMIDAFKKTRPTWFAGVRGAGSPSMRDGRAVQPDLDKDAREANFRRLRRST